MKNSYVRSDFDKINLTNAWQKIFIMQKRPPEFISVFFTDSETRSE